MVNKNNIEHYNYCLVNKDTFEITLSNTIEFSRFNFQYHHVLCDVSFMVDYKLSRCYLEGFELKGHFVDEIIPLDELKEKPIPESVKHHKPNWFQKKVLCEEPYDYVKCYYYVKGKNKVRFDVLRTPLIIRKQ